MEGVSWVAKTTRGFNNSLGGPTGPTQYTVTLTATMYLSKRTRCTISKGKGTWDKVQGKPGTGFPESSPSGITQDVLNFASNRSDNTCGVLSPREARQRLSAQGFFGDELTLAPCA